jgi:site-specific recombinase XerD
MPFVPTLHDDRRSGFARAFLKNDGDVFSLQRILGHSPASLQVTRRYGNLVSKRVPSATVRRRVHW